MLEKQCFDIYIYTYTYKGIKYWGIRRKVCFFPRCSLESLSVSSWYRNTKRVRSLTLREWRIENREENLAACRPRNESTCGECNLAWRNTGVGTVVTLVSLARSFFPFLSFFGRDRRENRSVFFFFRRKIGTYLQGGRNKGGFGRKRAFRVSVCELQLTSSCANCFERGNERRWVA